jgi:hypothetical protein
LPASVFGPPLLPLRRLAWRCRSDAIRVPIKKMERAPDKRFAPVTILAFGRGAGERFWG